MIRLDKVNKYFNRHKKNEIHVINEVSLDLPESGLIALLGPSGSGKTTLLNAIGGLDKVNKGSIYVNNEKITRRSSKKIDKIRNLNIGYIFQDYKLVEDLSVYDNVALSLKIIGIKDKKELDKIITYTLDKVNMLRFKKRPVNMLSGGERQRVGIARSLVKNPKIIIADEPTGNLDSKNSIEIMNIIKSISKKYLVVLVTHEEELARFYADRIIELQDGKIIKDYKNDSNNTLNYEIENNIYLKDYENITHLKEKNINIDVYQNDKEKIDIKLIFKNGNIYIKSENSDKLEIIDNNSNIEVINDHYKEIKDINVDNNTFDMDYIESDVKKKYSSIFKLGSFLTSGYKKILNYPILKKILLGGFFISGMFVFYGISNIFGTLDIKDEDFISMNKKYLTVEASNIKVKDYLEYENNEDIDYILPSDSIVTFELDYDKYLQTEYGKGSFSGSLSDINMINSDNLIMGVMPKDDYEIVVDKLVLKNFIKSSETSVAGFYKIDDFLNHEVYLNNMNKFKIVGISDINEPNIYASRDLFINMLSNSVIDDYEEYKFIDYNIALPDIKLVKGKLPVNDYEVLLPKDNMDYTELNKKIDVKINGKKLKVVGFYENKTYLKYKDYLVNNNTIKYSLVKKAKQISIYSKNDNNVLDYFHDKKINIYSSYDYSKNNYIASQYDSIKAALILSSVILGISLLEILLMIRSSFLSRIKEVGIYRAIGVKKSDIYKMFMGEIIAITSTASLFGICFMTYILDTINKMPFVNGMFMVNLFTFLLSIIVVFVFNLVVGLIPVYNTIRKTPAQILARKDID